MTAAIRACGSWANTASSSGTFLSGLGINGWLGSGPDPETGAAWGARGVPSGVRVAQAAERRSLQPRGEAS